MKTIKLFEGTLCALLVGGLLVSSCTPKDEVKAADTYYGSEVSVGNGTARTFLKVDNAGNPVSVGVKLTEAALQNLPDGHNHRVQHTEAPSFPLPLPQQKLRTPFDHVTLDWNPVGHPPENVYDKPHFDIHFYMMSEQERMAIGPEDPKIEELPEARYMPETYVPIPGGVPQMGKHWVDPASMQQPFTHTFLYGTYNGRVTFYEPMVTLSHLQSKTKSVSPIAQPRAFHKTGLYYPSTYRIEYSEQEKAYFIILDGLQLK
ncbi:DUF5602 domain-containing protein [Telluribacter sp. SYSU D00476]|uniref:DUF5602 domain-containing protein n=1 Tax=Telluribacter sp. SYSU D00476 TaxID=2811430 RepID=UPI001FF361B4|nr:DUF5602 domain-containing protein [Telluribacter sp. SYSU D00476]